MASAQKDMVTGPFAMVMALIVMIMTGMVVDMAVSVVVVNRHDATLAQRHAEFSP